MSMIELQMHLSILCNILLFFLLKKHCLYITKCCHIIRHVSTSKKKRLIKQLECNIVIVIVEPNYINST